MLFEEKLMEKIKEELIEPTYYQDIKDNLNGRETWKKIGDVTEAISKIFAGLATVAAFAAGFFNITILSFISGCLGTLALVIQQFSTYSYNESKERTNRVNKILTDLGLKNILDLSTYNLLETGIGKLNSQKKIIFSNNFHETTNTPNNTENDIAALNI